MLAGGISGELIILLSFVQNFLTDISLGLYLVARLAVCSVCIQLEL